MTHPRHTPCPSPCWSARTIETPPSDSPRRALAPAPSTRTPTTTKPKRARWTTFVATSIRSPIRSPPVWWYPADAGAAPPPRSFDAPPWKDGAEDRAERIDRTRTRTRSRKDGIDRTSNANANANVSRDARVEEFRRMMRERYVDGTDGDAEYRRVDADASLDDAWTRETERDAEDAYFDGE